jgi:hypothetical protein
MFDPQADRFFEDPRINRSPPGDFSILYLLRRDICRCLGWDPSSNSKTSHPTLWPGGMAVLAGIDLVAKFYKGDDTIGQVGPRFREFISNYDHLLSLGDDEIIYQLRNSLLHSFGLYSKTKTREYRFLLTAVGGVPLIQLPLPGFYQVDLIVLYERFEQALGRYVADLENQKSLQNNFRKMLKDYGVIHIG